MRKNPMMVVLPMHKSLVTLTPIKGDAPLIDFSAMISKYRPEPTWRKWARRVVRAITFFW
jgi:hypothetical protein